MENKNLSPLAKKIRILRKERGLTIEELSNNSGINISTLKKYENDFRNPKIEQLEKIANGIGVSIYEFIDYKIETISDVISLLIKLSTYTNLEILHNDESNTISFAFNNQNINDVLNDYWDIYLEQSDCLIEKANSSQILSGFLLNNKKI